jgi:large subunit ribosomal protein L23
LARQPKIPNKPKLPKHFLATLAHLAYLEILRMHLYEVLKRPITTEKSNRLKDEQRKYAFEVDMRANKFQIKEAVETAFKVNVVSVNVMRMSRKRRHYGRFVSYKPLWKRAVVTVRADQRIDLFEGV